MNLCCCQLGRISASWPVKVTFVLNVYIVQILLLYTVWWRVNIKTLNASSWVAWNLEKLIIFTYLVRCSILVEIRVLLLILYRFAVIFFTTCLPYEVIYISHKLSISHLPLLKSFQFRQECKFFVFCFDLLLACWEVSVDSETHLFFIFFA